MYALEPEPERKGRARRLGIGAAITVALGAALIFGAEHVEPARRLLPDVVKLSFVSDPEPPKTPPPPPPPPPELPKPKLKPKAEPKPEALAQPKEAPPPPPPADQPQPTEQPPASESVGLDADSFGSGSGGAAFHQGTTVMGTPTGARPAPPPVASENPFAKVVAARARKGNTAPEYSERARKKQIEGLVVIETEIDDKGRVVRAFVRDGLDPELDEAARRAVLSWAFEPAMRAGLAIASTQFLRIRFQLER